MSKVSTTPVHLTQSSPRKRGRHAARHRLANGKEIEGLKRQKDGRWRISATNEFFTEPDEMKAVARFEAAMAELEGRTRVQMPLPADLGPEQAAAALHASGGARLQAVIRKGKPPAYSMSVGSAAYWAAVTRDLADPVNVSRMTGIEWVARGSALPKLMPSPTLKELIDTYAAKAGITKEEITRCKSFWKVFADCVGIATIRELTHGNVAKYETVLDDDTSLGPKSVKHRYTRIRTVIAYAMKRGKNPDDCQRALNILKMLEAPEANALDPNPINKPDFWAIYSQASKAGDATFATLMLFALNAAMYPSEVGSVRWAEIDLKVAEFSSKRRKSAVPRVAVLWPETVAALKIFPHDRETVFNTSRQKYTRFSVHRAWETYRSAAKRKSVMFNMIRDAAFTIACQTDLNQARILAGHRLPGAVDNYVRRAPQFVGAACEAIRTTFDVAYNARRTKA